MLTAVSCPTPPPGVVPLAPLSYTTTTSGAFGTPLHNPTLPTIATFFSSSHFEGPTTQTSDTTFNVQ